MSNKTHRSTWEKVNKKKETTMTLQTIYGYHNYYEELNFFTPGKKETNRALFIGMELETDQFPNYDAVRQCADALNKMNEKEVRFHNEHDSSLHCGFEIVTMPATLGYITYGFPIQKMLKTIEKFGGKSHEAGTCGLHFHVNRSWFGKQEDICTLKILYLFEKFWSQFWTLSRRQGSSNHYCQRYGDSTFASWAKERPMRRRSKINDCRRMGRYQAVNLCKDHTIEFRIFRGTLKYESLMASMQLIDYICRMVKKTSIEELESMDWAGFVTKISEYKTWHAKENRYQMLLNYLAEKHLA